MNAIGLCHHNNRANYCPSCAKEKAMGRMGSTMGADCQPGYYRLKVFGVDTGQCLPTLSTAVEGAQGGALSTVASGVASSPATASAAQTAAANALGAKVTGFFYDPATRQVKWVNVGIVGALAAFALYGGMSFLRGK